MGIKWFYRCGDVSGRLRLRPDPRLLLASHHEDENSSEAVDGKATVYFYKASLPQLQLPKDAKAADQGKVDIDSQLLRDELERNPNAYLCAGRTTSRKRIRQSC